MYLHPNSFVHKIDKSLPPQIAVMFNPLGAGYRWAVEVPKLQVGDTLVVLGPGQRGLARVIPARQAGAGDLIVTGLESDGAKLELASTFGATHPLDVTNANAKPRIT